MLKVMSCLVVLVSLSIIRAENAISIVKIESMHNPVFKNLQLCYEAEFAPITQTALLSNGTYDQAELASHWAKKTMIYLFYVNQLPAGFCVINAGSMIDENRPDVHDFAEFYIMPLYRKRSIGITCAASLIRLYGGVWQIRQLPELEQTGRLFWLKVIDTIPVRNFHETFNHPRWPGFMQEFEVGVQFLPAMIAHSEYYQDDL